MIPGLNLLNLAFSLIKPAAVPYYAYAGRTQNAVAQFIPQFKAAQTLYASVQRVPRSKYVAFNLEFQRNYVQIYAKAELIDLERDASGDQIIWGGRLYQIESQGTWFLQDGWASALAVDVGPATPLPYVPDTGD